CVALILAFAIVMIISMWKVYEKADQPGWAVLIPFYNSYILTCEIARKEIIWFIMLFLPFVGIVSAFIVALEVARRFGRTDAYGLGLFFLLFIFYPLLPFICA